MKAFTIILEGKEDGVPCDKDVRIKVWKQGHSIKCPKMTALRYWQPKPDIFEELKDHCKGCHRFDYLKELCVEDAKKHE